MRFSVAVYLALLALFESALSEPAAAPLISRSQNPLETCSTFADMYETVKLNEDNENCYDLLSGGLATRVGTVCMKIEELSNGKTCVQFLFTGVGEWQFIVVEAGARQGCVDLEEGDNPYTVSDEGLYSTKTLDVCLDTVAASPEPDGEGCCNGPLCLYASVRARLMTDQGTTELRAIPEIDVNNCEVWFDGMFGFRVVGCSALLICEDPVPQELPCQDYTDDFSTVKIGNEENTTCFQLHASGSTSGARVGTVCLSIKWYTEKTCIAFTFRASYPYVFKSAKAGLANDCADEQNWPYQVSRYGHFTFKRILVCLDKFSSPPGVDNEGCCNEDICAFSRVATVDRRRHNSKRVLAYPKNGGNGCEEADQSAGTKCNVPLICTDPK